jgi:hypothetical protein
MSRPRIQQGHLGHGFRPMTDLLAFAAEGGDLGHQLHLPVVNRTVPFLAEVRLIAAALRENDGRFLLELRDGFQRSHRMTLRRAEGPRHQVPRLALVLQAPRREARRVQTVLWRKIAGEKGHVRGDRFRHVVAERPVAGDLELGIRFLEGPDVVAQVFPERLTLEIPPLGPARVAGLLRQLTKLELPAKRLCRRFAVVGNGRPALAVHPDAVHAVIPGQFAELGNEQPVDVRSERRGFVGIRFAIGLDHRPVRMKSHGFGIPDARVMHVQRDAALGGDLTPQAQRIPDEARRGIAHAGRIAGEARVALAIDLEIVRFHLGEDVLDHRPGGVPADLGAILAGVEIEMDAEEGFRAFEPGRIGRLFGGLGFGGGETETETGQEAEDNPVEPVTSGVGNWGGLHGSGLNIDSPRLKRSEIPGFLWRPRRAIHQS